MLLLGESWNRSKNKGTVGFESVVQEAPVWAGILKALNEDCIKKFIDMCAFTLHAQDRWGRTSYHMQQNGA